MSVSKYLLLFKVNTFYLISTQVSLSFYCDFKYLLLQGYVELRLGYDYPECCLAEEGVEGHEYQSLTLEVYLCSRPRRLSQKL